MRCGKCGFENPQGMEFCGQCTDPLALICPKCSFENPLGFKFCAQCTAPLSASDVKAAPPIRMGEAATDAEAVEGERKTVTALFADIKGSIVDQVYDGVIETLKFAYETLRQRLS